MKVKTLMESKYSSQNKEMVKIRVNVKQNVEIDGKRKKNYSIPTKKRQKVQ